MDHVKKACLVILSIGFLAACSSVKPDQIKKMPPPAIMDDTRYNPFMYGAVIQDRQRLPILYATNRIPAGENDKETYYLSNRTDSVRLGMAGIGVAGEGMTWDDLTLIEASRTNNKDPLLQVRDVKEFGILERSLSPFSDRNDRLNASDLPEKRFLLELKSQLEDSRVKDVYIFVHGYNVNFENPLLMTAQLWHYLGYRGSFISYCWPSTPRGTAYMKDLDTASMSARSFRIFLDFLSEQEEIDRIHILGYSAGTRLVTQTLYQKALLMSEIPSKDAQLKTKLGTVILAASDMDRALFGSYLLDGQLNILERMNLYTSSKDLVLRGSKTVHFTPRMGQTLSEEEMTPAIRKYFSYQDKLRIIDVSDADQVTTNGGHFYFLESPWVSSDVLLNLRTGFRPENRGLVPHPDLPIWQFPPDYIERSRNAIDKVIEEGGLSEY